MCISLFPSINPFGLFLELVRLHAVRVREGVQAGGGVGWAQDVLHHGMRSESAGVFLDTKKKGPITNSLIN